MTDIATADPTLFELARQAGLMRVWQDVHGHMHQVSGSILQTLLEGLGLQCRSLSQIKESLHRLATEARTSDGRLIVTDVDTPVVLAYAGPLNYVLVLESGERRNGTAKQLDMATVMVNAIPVAGYHTLHIGDVHLSVAVAPMQCPTVRELSGKSTARLWGISAQLYGLRRYGAVMARPHTPDALTPAGDYTALAALARQAALQGASAVAISPVHAMFSADPSRYSPYAPSSRLFLNAAYIDPAAVFGRAAVGSALAKSPQPTPPDTPTDARGDKGSDALIDWPGVAGQRLHALRQLFDRCEAQPVEPARCAFAAFCKEGGTALERHAIYEALHAHYAQELGPGNGWRDWPAGMQDPAGPQVRAYAHTYRHEVRFHAFLQWLADEGMRSAQHSARDAGMPVGLIADLAIGSDPRGSHAWSRQADIITGVAAGAPPDLYQPAGQNWGLTVFSPRAFRDSGYAPFIETLRAAFRHAGGVRIDHILGLARMWLVPDRGSAADGAYLRYPLDDMLRLVVLEASRHRALVIGENLGTVPPDFNDRLYEKGILGTSVLWFERQPSGAAFAASPDWPARAMATSTTHDLPTVAGWWQGNDLQWRDALGQVSSDARNDLMENRQGEKKALWQALCDAGCVTADPCDAPTQAPREAILAFVASAPSPITIIPLEDLLGLLEQPNLPGTHGTVAPFHPNWLRRLPVAVEDLFTDPGVRGCIAAIVRARGNA